MFHKYLAFYTIIRYTIIRSLLQILIIEAIYSPYTFPSSRTTIDTCPDKFHLRKRTAVIFLLWKNANIILLVLF